MSKGIVIVGPTGIGKTDLAVALAQRLGGELISCDSVQVYRHLNIGANKAVTPVPQWLIDVVDWNCSFTAADFLHLATERIRDITRRNRLPILVGGTGFYVDWLVEGRPTAPATDPQVLAQVEASLRGLSWEEARARLQSVDFEYATKIGRNDWYRLKRSLVVYQMTGRPLSSFPTKPSSVVDSQGEAIDWRCFYLGYADRRALLHHLDRRCESMVAMGLLEEVIDLQQNGLSTSCQAGRSIGYQETLHFLQSLKQNDELLLKTPNKSIQQIDKLFCQFLKEFQAVTRQYTRKQEKWFWNKPYYRWLERKSLSGIPDPDLVDWAINLFELSREQFDDVTNPLVAPCIEFKQQCRPTEGSPTSKRKLLRTFQSQLQIFQDQAYRERFLDNITSKLAINQSVS